jgi:hypothetical protein
MKQRVTIQLLGVGLGCLILLIFGELQIERARQPMMTTYTAPKSDFPVEMRQIMAGEFKGLTADYLLLEIGSFIGSNIRGTPQDWKNIYFALKHALALDPYFQQTYIYAQGNLPWDADLYAETNELLDISRRHRPWDWRPGFYMGFNCYYFLADYAKASEIFLEIAKIKDSPALIPVLGARFAHKAQQAESAVALLEGMLTDPGLDDFKRSEIKKRIQALRGALILEQALARHKQTYGGYPSRLDTLVDKKLITAMPVNPYETHYRFDPQSGRVFFDRVE